MPWDNDADNNDLIHGGDVYRNEVTLDYSVNLNPMRLPAEVLDAAMQGLREMHQYPDPLQQELREKIAAYEGVGSENVVCGNGASELIMAAVHAVMPRKAAVTAPSYAGYAKALSAVGAEIREYSLDEGDGFRVREDIEDFLTEDIDMLFIADPNNPTGRLIEPEVKRRISEVCAARGIVPVWDECFLPLTERGLEEHLKKEKLSPGLHLRAFTKTFAVPGIRIGYMISGDTELLGRIRDHLPEWNVSRIAERAGAAAAEVLSETDYLMQSVRLAGYERNYLESRLEELGIRTYPGDANYLLLRAEPDFYERLLARGVLIRRCANFSGLDDTYFRIAVRGHADNEELIRIIGEIL